MRGGILTLVLALLVLTPALGASTPASPTPPIVTEKFPVAEFEGKPVMATLMYPSGSAPTLLVVMVHGVGNTVEGAWLGHMAETAAKGAAVVATNFRDNNGFPTLRGAQDTNVAALTALAKFPSVKTVILFGVSMGGSVSGVAIAENPTRTVAAPCAPVCASSVTEVPLYDYWIDVEGVSNVFETYYQAKAVGHYAAAGLERDAGGAPHQVPAEFARRSPALRAHEMSLKGAVVIHSVNDGTVPYDQGQEMAAALVAAGIPTEFHTILRERFSHDEGTTGTGRLAGLAGQADPSETSGAHLSGHAWEGDRESIVMRTAFDRLFALMAGATITTLSATVVDGPLQDGPLLP